VGEEVGGRRIEEGEKEKREEGEFYLFINS
jgi:hypothetical protein